MYIYSNRAFPKPFLRDRIRTIMYWKTRVKFETRQLVTPFICDPDTKLNQVVRFSLDEGFWRWSSFQHWG